MSRAPTPARTRTTGTIFLVIGIVLFLVLETVAVVLAVRAAQRSDWPHADGTVVEVSTYVDRDTSRRNGKRRRTTETTMYTPVVEYAVDGQQYRFTSKVSTSKPWSVGDTVEVVYNPDNPHDAAIAGATAWVPWLLGGLGLLFGLVFGGVGLLILTGRMRSRRSGGSLRRPGSADADRDASDGDTYKDFSAPSQSDEPRGGPFGGR